jgi:hypothetical protein
LSIEKLSLGNLNEFVHYPIVIGSDKIFYNEKFDEYFISTFFNNSFHFSIVSSRYYIGKAPKYAIIPELIKESPTVEVELSLKFAAFSVQAPFSPPKPEINLSARTNYSSQV